MSASISDRVNNVVEGLNADENLTDKEISEIKYEVSQSGHVTEVVAVLTAGGPHIEVECLRGVVAGQWSGETFRRGIENDEVTEFGRRRAEAMENRID